MHGLSAQPPDLEEVRRALTTIADDGNRASEIVVQLQAPKKSPLADDLLVLDSMPPRCRSSVAFFGPTEASADVRFRAFVKGKADVKCALIRSVPTYEYTP